MPGELKAGKWEQWNFFAEEEGIRPYLPSTALFSIQTLRSYLSMYELVFVKPDKGRGGRGVVKIWRRKEGGYAFIREKGRSTYCRTIDELYRKLMQGRNAQGRYIIQEGIRLPLWRGRPFDIRLSMMRDNGCWKAVGALARVAGPDSAITNIARGRGRVVNVRQALKSSLGLHERGLAAVEADMEGIGHRVCQKFDEIDPYWQVGLDIAVDTNRKLWLIEANTIVDQSLFARLKDLSMYREMQRITKTHTRSK
ncbi:YheC/YheD family protein [Aneurinibacillus sp. BA2021]|nr:YheC/YheD family protein [Aneurinibacillus sp. BA2021]